MPWYVLVVDFSSVVKIQRAQLDHRPAAATERLRDRLRKSESQQTRRGTMDLRGSSTTERVAESSTPKEIY